LRPEREGVTLRNLFDFLFYLPPFGHFEPILSGMAKLTKRDIVVSISNQTGMVQHEVFDVVQRTLDQITDSLAKNVAVELRNFGVFQPRLTKPRVGRNPNQPGSSFVIPPRATVKFKAGKIMRQRVEKLSRELKEASDRNGEASDQSRASVN
jgi:nucleoid DNA-binding protein